MKIEDVLPFQCCFVKQRFHELNPQKKIRHLLMTYLKVISKEVVPDKIYVTEKKDKGNVLFFRSLYRQDYIELFHNVADAYPFSSVICFVNGHKVMDTSGCFCVLGFGESLKRFLVSCLYFIRYLSLIIYSICNYGLFKGLWLYLQFLKISLFFDNLLRHKPSGVVVFAEMQDMDRILSLKCRRKGIPCSSMQHGLYADYETIETVNRINYKPQFVSHFLAWGQHTHDLIKNYCPWVEVKICGKPADDLVPEVHSGDHPFGCVLIFDQDIFKEQNAEMLNIVKEVFSEHEGGLAVRFHPQNRPEDYDLANVKILDNDAGWPEAECYVGHTTTFLLQLLRAEVKLFRYATDAESVVQEPRIEFTNSNELKTLLGRSQYKGCEALEKYIAMTGADSIKAHIYAINNMLNSAA